MRFATLHHAGRLAFGLVDGDQVVDVSGTFASPADALTLDGNGVVACASVEIGRAHV